MTHPKERELVEDIDLRGGVSLTIRWPEEETKDGAQHA